VKLRPQDRRVIEDLRYDTKIKKIYIRYSIILLLDDAYSYAQISAILGINEKMIQRVCKLYEESGVDGLAVFHYKGRSSYLNEKQEQVLRKELREYLHKDTKEIQIFIQRRFKRQMTRSAIGIMLHRIGFVYKKTKILPGKANGEEQKRFASKLVQLKSRLKKDETLYFIDGVHPTYNTRPSYGWIEKGTDYNMPSNTGRQRININGAMNGGDPTDIVVDFAEMINAQSTIRLFEKIEAKNPYKRNIYVIGDNAWYYNSKLLKEWLREHPRIKYLPLPPYSPNLNLIERLWGFMYREQINNFYFETYDKFRKAVVDFFKNISDWKEELNSLITWKFQIVQW
jgi:transposase